MGRTSHPTGHGARRKGVEHGAQSTGHMGPGASDTGHEGYAAQRDGAGMDAVYEDWCRVQEWLPVPVKKRHCHLPAAAA